MIETNKIYSHMRNAKIVKVIEVECVEGKGNMKSVARSVKYYFSLDGKILAKNDPHPEEPPFDFISMIEEEND